jgi:hypothetical protein
MRVPNVLHLLLSLPNLGKKINVIFLHQKLKSLPFLPFTHTTVLQMSYSEPESDLESELEGEPAEDQPANYIQECLAEADRTYQAWSTPPTPPPAPPPATSDVQPAKTTRPTTRRGRGYLLTLLSSPVLVSEDNARPDADDLPATSSTSPTLSTSSRIVPTKPTVRVQPYARRIVTRQEEVLKMVTEEENAEIVADRWYINQQMLLNQKYQDLLNEIRRRYN